jgi:hypothetical protein
MEVPGAHRGLLLSMGKMIRPLILTMLFAIMKPMFFSEGRGQAEQ